MTMISTTRATLPPVSLAGLTTAQAAQVQSVVGMQGADAGAHRYVAPAAPLATEMMRQVLVDGSYGPVAAAGTTAAIHIPDGPGFGGVAGYRQGPADASRNSYSVLDPNFFAALGVLRDPATGGARSFTSQVQAYDAAGYVQVFHPDLYQRMIAAQAAGQGSVLGMSLSLLGVPGAPADPGLAAAGLSAGMLLGEQVPGSPLLARDAVLGATDMTGAPWSQPSHAESRWRVYARLVESGVDWHEAGALSSDDAISAAGRLNGWAAQADTATGLTDAEVGAVRRAAQLEARTGVPALFIMGGAHNHAGVDPNARSLPRINQTTGLAATDRSASAERIAAIKRAVGDAGGGLSTTTAGGPEAALAMPGNAVNGSLAELLTKLVASLAALTALIERLAPAQPVTAGGATTPDGGCSTSRSAQVAATTTPPVVMTNAS